MTDRSECMWYQICPIKYFTERATLDQRWVDSYCRGDWENCVRFQMVRRGEYHPDWMLPDGSLDESLRDV